MEAKVVAPIRILIQNQTTKVAATKKRKVDLIQIVRLNIVNKRFPFKKPILSRYDVKDNITFSNSLFLFAFYYYCDFCKKVTCRALQGALKLKINMKGQNMLEYDIILC